MIVQPAIINGMSTVSVTGSYLKTKLKVAYVNMWSHAKMPCEELHHQGYTAGRYHHREVIGNPCRCELGVKSRDNGTGWVRNIPGE